MYGRERLIDVEKKKSRIDPNLGLDEDDGDGEDAPGRMIVDPVTGDVYPRSVLKKVYIT